MREKERVKSVREKGRRKFPSFRSSRTDFSHWSFFFPQEAKLEYFELRRREEKTRQAAAMASNSNHRGTSSGIQIGSAWFQRKINLRPQHRGVHLVTEEILRQMPELGQFSVGLCHVQSEDCFFSFMLHTEKNSEMVYTRILVE